MAAGMSDLLNSGKEGIGMLVDMIVRPPRAEYSVSDLGPENFTMGSRRFQRTDFTITNRRGHVLQCSHFQPEDSDRPRQQLPCVIYAHGNCGCRLDALPVVPLVLPYDMTMLCFDFSGCGKSGGEYISLGYFEQEDLTAIIQHLKASGRVSQIGIWGRSMGAATCLLFASNDKPPGTVQCIVADSGFTSLSGLARELVERSGVSVPGMVLSMAIRWVRSAIEKKAHFDIEKLAPVKKVKKARCPALFAHGESDNFITPKHSDELLARYGGQVKNLIKIDGDHNSPRPRFFNDSVSIFLNNHLLVGPDAFNQESYDRCVAPGEEPTLPWMGGYRRGFPMGMGALGGMGDMGDEYFDMGAMGGMGGMGMGGIGGMGGDDALLQQALAASLAAPPQPDFALEGGAIDDEEEFMRQQLERIALMEQANAEDLPPDYDPSLFE